MHLYYCLCRGHEAVDNEKIFEVYRDTHLSMDLLDAPQKVLYTTYVGSYLTLEPAKNFWGMRVYTIWVCIATLGGVT